LKTGKIKVEPGVFKMNFLLVDDDQATLKLIAPKLSAWGHTVHTAENGKNAWEIIKTTPIEIVVSDWMMPDLNGLELCGKIRSKESGNYIYIILISAKDSSKDIVRGLSGGVDDYITKPINFEELRARIDIGSRIVRLERELNEKYNTIRNNYLQTIEMFIYLIEMFDEDLGGHSRRVGDISLQLAEKHGDVSSKAYKTIQTAGLLHDIGMIGLPKSILSKRRTEMVEGEQDLFRSHPYLGKKILDEIEYLSPISKIVGMHHEQYNGRGFPDGLPGKDIPIEAQIVSAASIYDNLIHRGGISYTKIPDHLQRIRGYQLSPQLADMLLEINFENIREDEKASDAEIRLDQLEAGMILTKNIRMKTGAFVMPSGTRLTRNSIEKLIHYLAIGAISKTVYIEKDSIRR